MTEQYIPKRAETTLQISLLMLLFFHNVEYSAFSCNTDKHRKLYTNSNNEKSRLICQAVRISVATQTTAKL